MTDIATKIRAELEKLPMQEGVFIAKQIESLLITGNKITCVLAENTPEAIKNTVEKVINSVAPFMQIAVMQTQPITPKSPPKPAAAEGGDPAAGIEHINKVVAVASGKGGVGKSTVTVNLAIALAAKGLKVGLLDADIYGPSIPIMLGSSARPSSPDGKTIVPITAHGIKSLSIGYMLENQEAVVWRGPMLHSALQQMLLNVLWGELDVLMIDMPPGTGDVALTLAQKARLDGAIIVTTPQNVALADARKAIGMFDRVSVPIIGIIENMSYHQCEKCGNISHLFGQGGGKTEAETRKLPLLGHLPLHPKAAGLADQGITLADQSGILHQEFASIADQLIAHW